MPAPTAPQAAPQAGICCGPAVCVPAASSGEQQGLPANNAQPSAAARTANAPTEQALGYSGSAPAAGMPINFAAGSARVEPDSYGFIRSVAEVLQTDPGMSLVIEGHTDATGSYQRNMVLSWERAMGVYRMLVEQFGIEPTRLQLQGKGPMSRCRVPPPSMAPIAACSFASAAEPGTGPAARPRMIQGP
ncbi:MAG: OmpA family protein [Burkholderiaceae bacterium]